MAHVDVFRYEPRESVLHKVACAFIQGDEVRVKSTWDQRDYSSVIRDVLDRLPGPAEVQLNELPGMIRTPYLKAIFVEDDSTSEIALQSMDYEDRYVGVDPLRTHG